MNFSFFVVFFAFEIWCVFIEVYFSFPSFVQDCIDSNSCSHSGKYVHFLISYLLFGSWNGKCNGSILSYLWWVISLLYFLFYCFDYSWQSEGLPKTDSLPFRIKIKLNTSTFSWSHLWEYINYIVAVFIVSGCQWKHGACSFHNHFSIIEYMWYYNCN